MIVPGWKDGCISIVQNELHEAYERNYVGAVLSTRSQKCCPIYILIYFSFKRRFFNRLFHLLSSKNFVTIREN